MARFACPTCGKEMEVADNSAGGVVNCPHCQAACLIPAPAATTPPASPAMPPARPPTPPVAAVASESQKTSGAAVAGFILSLAGLVVPLITSLLGLIFSIVGLGKTGAGRMKGRGLAVAGLVLSIAIPLLYVPLVFAITLPALGHAREYAKRASCSTNLSSIGKGIAMYQMDNNDQFPPSLDALQASNFVPQSAMRCPSDSSGRPVSYFYFPARTDSDSGTFVACDWEDNHRAVRNILYADTHVGYLSEEQFQQELTQPYNAAFAAALRRAESSGGGERP